MGCIAILVILAFVIWAVLLIVYFVEEHAKQDEQQKELDRKREQTSKEWDRMIKDHSILLEKRIKLNSILLWKSRLIVQVKDSELDYKETTIEDKNWVRKDALQVGDIVLHYQSESDYIDSLQLLKAIIQGMIFGAEAYKKKREKPKKKNKFYFLT